MPAPSKPRPWTPSAPKVSSVAASMAAPCSATPAHPKSAKPSASVSSSAPTACNACCSPKVGEEDCTSTDMPAPDFSDAAVVSKVLPSWLTYSSPGASLRGCLQRGCSAAEPLQMPLNASPSCLKPVSSRVSDWRSCSPESPPSLAANVLPSGRMSESGESDPGKSSVACSIHRSILRRRWRREETPPLAVLSARRAMALMDAVPATTGEAGAAGSINKLLTKTALASGLPTTYGNSCS